MCRLRFLIPCFFLLVWILFLPDASIGADSPRFDSRILDHIRWRGIGPAAFGGRISDIEAVANNPNIIFVAGAHGGIFKTENAGTTWKAVFDKDGTSLSIGDIAIARSDSNIVWAGTGEPNNRNSSSWGDGIYKSIDGGETWKYMGLKESHHIGRVVIHPRNPEIVYVAALGHLWGPNPERGLYRTENGGKTWEKVLYITEDIGIVDVALEESGEVLYAAAYQRRRKAWGFVGGGPQGGIYRSMDGGDHWEKLSEGLPEGDNGRIGLDVSRSNPNIVYAFIENKNGGVFKSEDRGQSWTKGFSFNDDLFSPILRPMYFAQIRVDPKSPDKVWVLGAWLFLSKDGGMTFTSEGTLEKVHWDLHALWINPNNPNHLLLGTDGGVYVSYNGSKAWTFLDNLPLAMFYAIGIDNQNPYWIYGGTQDSGTYGIPSRTFCRQGILNSDVIAVLEGDSFYTVVDPNNPKAIFSENYSGRLFDINLDTGEKRAIRPVPKDPENETYRFNWSSPLIISSHDSNTVYFGGNKVFKTTDRGQHWEEISPDLTKNRNWKKIPIMGVERDENTLSRDDGVLHYGTITTISESPIQPGLIYVGTDDGNVHVTLDGGKNWLNLTAEFSLPGPRFVSRILASHHDIKSAYITFDGHWDDDFAPYIFKTNDCGNTWKSISGDLPDGMVVNLIAEHPRNPNLLFIGTEFGLFISIDGGKNWVQPRGNLPRAPVDDIIINAKQNDLILGTHGRSVFILDDITMLEQLDNAQLNSEAYLFPSKPAAQFYETSGLRDQGSAKFVGPNPEYGALITYYLKDDPPIKQTESQELSQVSIIIQDAEGKIIRELSGPDKKGLNRISWDLRYSLPFNPSGLLLGGAGFKGLFVMPGIYTVKLIARNQELMQKLEVEIDPRIKTNQQMLLTRFQASMMAYDIIRAYLEGREATHRLEKEIDRLEEIASAQKDLSEDIKNMIREVGNKIEEMAIAFKGGWFIGIESQITTLAGQLQSTGFSPTEADFRTAQYFLNKVNKYIETVNAIIAKDLPDLMERFSENNIPHSLVTKTIEPARCLLISYKKEDQ